MDQALIRALKAAAFGGVAALVLAHGPARGEVLEIGPDGGVERLDAPTPARRAVRAARPARTTLTTAPPEAGRAALERAARLADLSPALIAAVAATESGFRSGVRSPAGALGEMQLMPGTARQLGVDPLDTVQNYEGGARYLSELMRRYQGDLMRALAAYDAGPGRVDRWGSKPRAAETRAYVDAVLERLSRSATGGGR